MAQNRDSNMTLNDDGRVLYQTGKEIRITKRTVSFGSNVYQFRNIAGFCDGKIKRKASISWLVIAIGIIIGFTAIDIGGKTGININWNIDREAGIGIGRNINRETGFGITVLLICIGCIMINLKQGKKYGLILTLNSGDRHLFVTSDKDRMFGVIRQLYAFMESDQDGAYVVTVNDNSIKIENMTGVVASRTKNTTISSNASHSGDKA